jgi:hypothetical protein
MEKTFTSVFNICLVATFLLASFSAHSQDDKRNWVDKLFRKEKVEELKTEPNTTETQPKPSTEQPRRDSVVIPPLKPSPESKYDRKKGQVTVHTPPQMGRIDSLYKANPPKSDGFRIQIYFGDLTEARAKRSTFLAARKDIPCYLVQNSPNFAVQVGDFRDQLEAYRILQELKISYPGAIIVSTEIEMPRIAPRH